MGWQGNLITPREYMHSAPFLPAVLSRACLVILAQGFDILDGRVEIEVPWVMDRSDYSVVRE